MKKKKIGLVVIAICVTIAIIVGATYAFWTVQKSQTDNNVLIAGCLNFELTSQSPKITLEEAWPISDYEGAQLAGYSFRVTNQCDKDYEYQINLDSKEIAGENYLTYSSIDTLLDFGTITQYGDLTSQETTVEGVRDSKIVAMDVVGANSYNDHNIKLWIDSEAPVTDNGKAFEASISVTAGQGISIAYTPESCFTFVPETGTIVEFNRTDCGSYTDIIIPNKIGEVAVTTLGDGLLAGTEITKVVVPRGVTTIGSGIFSGCQNLTNIKLPYGLTTINASVVSGSPLITNLALPSTVTTLGGGAFASSSLEYLIIPDSVTTVEAGAISSEFNDIKIGGGITNLTSDMLGGATAQNIVLSSGTTTIGANAFSGTNGLESLTIPNTVTSIGDYGVSSLSNLKEVIFEEGGSSALTIGNSAFSQTPLLTSIELPDRLTSIGSYAFHGNSFAEVIIPGNVTSLGEEAFSHSTTLEKVIFESSTTPGTLTIGSNAFAYGAVKSVTFSNAVGTIGQYAFYNDPLETLSLSEGLETIEDSAFGGVFHSFTSLVIPDSVRTIGPSAFSRSGDIIRINSLDLGDGVTSIGHHAFNQCLGATSVTIPASVTTMGADAFGNNTLTGIHVNNTSSAITALNWPTWHDAGVTVTYN